MLVTLRGGWGTHADNIKQGSERSPRSLAVAIGTAVMAAEGGIIASGIGVRAVNRGNNEAPSGEGGSPGRWSVFEECSGT